MIWDSISHSPHLCNDCDLRHDDDYHPPSQMSTCPNHHHPLHCLCWWSSRSRWLPPTAVPRSPESHLWTWSHSHTSWSMEPLALALSKSLKRSHSRVSTPQHWGSCWVASRTGTKRRVGCKWRWALEGWTTGFLGSRSRDECSKGRDSLGLAASSRKSRGASILEIKKRLNSRSFEIHQWHLWICCYYQVLDKVVL